MWTNTGTCLSAGPAPEDPPHELNRGSTDTPRSGAGCGACGGSRWPLTQRPTTLERSSRTDVTTSNRTLTTRMIVASTFT